MFVRALSSCVASRSAVSADCSEMSGFEAADRGVDPVEHGEHVVERALGRAGVDLGRRRRARGGTARSSEPHVGDVAEREHDAVDQIFDHLLRAHVDAGRPVVGEGGGGRGDELGGRGGVLARPVVDGLARRTVPARCRRGRAGRIRATATAVASTGSVPASRAVILSGSIAKSIFDIARRSVAGPNRYGRVADHACRASRQAC